MENCEGEIECLKHSFWQILSLSKQLLARNEVLKAKIVEQDRSFEWKIAEMQKSIDDLKRKNTILQKKLSIDDEDLNVISKDYQEVMNNSLRQVGKGNNNFAVRPHDMNEKHRKKIDNSLDDDVFEKESDSEDHSV